MILQSDLKLSVEEQKQNLAAKNIGSERTILSELKLSPEFILIITGVRRCGKSTLMKQLSLNLDQKFSYFNFEDTRISGFETSDFVKLEQALDISEYYFFDEIQNISKWEVFIRKLHDKGRKICLTGSNASLLSKELGTRLTGRNIQIELFPFSFSEFCEFTKQSKNLEGLQSYLELGGFPDYLKNTQIAYLQQVFKDILFRDIIVRYGIRNAKTVEQIALFLISNVGKEYSLNGIKNTFGVGSANSVADYISWFEDSYLLFSVARFSWSLKSVAVNPKKVYTIDTGFAQANSLSYSKDQGRLLENAVFIHLRRSNQEIFYFREKHECDFVVRKQNKVTLAIQVCYELNQDNLKRECYGLLEALHFFDLEKGYIITLNQHDQFQMEGKIIDVLPAYEWFENSIMKN